MTQDEFDKLRSGHQHTLIDFLKAELGLGFAFASRGNTENALKAIHATERFIDEVEDSVARREISEELEKLKSQVSSGSKPNP